MLGTGEVWFARLEDIARHVLALRERGEYDIRGDRLPYYDRPRSRTRRRRRWCGAQSEAAAGFGNRLVKVAPAHDPAGVTAIFAAQILLNFLGFVLHGRSKAGAGSAGRLHRSSDV
jgi:hypothetical protein